MAAGGTWWPCWQAEREGRTPAAPGTEPQPFSGSQTLLVPGCFPSPPVRDVGTSSAAPFFSPLPADTSVARQMDGGYQSLHRHAPQELLRPEKLGAAPFLSKDGEARAEPSPQDGMGRATGEAGSGPHLALLIPQSHMGQTHWSGRVRDRRGLTSLAAWTPTRPWSSTSWRGSHWPAS